MSGRKASPPHANVQQQGPRKPSADPRPPGVLQPKTAQAQARHAPAAPPVYRPQPAPKVLQKKSAAAQPQLSAGPKRAPAAPPVYRPQPAPKVLQPKMSQPAAPSVRPKRAPSAPPVYRPQPTPKVLQRKTANAPRRADNILNDSGHDCATPVCRTPKAAQALRGNVSGRDAAAGAKKAHACAAPQGVRRPPLRNAPGAIQRMENTYANQPIIDNYIPNSPYYQTNTLFTQTNFTYHILRDEIRIEGDDTDYTATWVQILQNDQTGETDEKVMGQVGELELYEEGGRYWINQVHVPDRARRKGIAKNLLQAAINEHGTIYASLQSAEEDNNGNGDSRHLTDDGDALVTGCMNAGMNIVKAHPSQF